MEFDQSVAFRYTFSMLEITFKKTPLKVLRRMQPKRARQIRETIAAVAANPANPGLDVKRLVGCPGYRLRVGDWRVIFDMDATTLDVIEIGRRGDVYKPRKRR